MMSSSKRVKLANEEVIDRFLANVDVWRTIFEMLPAKDRIRLEMTNKRLRMMMLACWKRVTQFDTKCVTEMSDNPSMRKKRKKNRKQLSWTKRSAAFIAICVDRIGDGLRSLTIRGNSTFPIRFWTDNVPSIGEGCPNVDAINIVFEDEDVTLDIRLDSFSRLKTLTVSNYFVFVSASLFLSIPASIEVIHGLELKREEYFENSAQIEGLFAHRPSLREVCLGSLYTRYGSKADIFRVIAKRCPHLKSIKLAYSNCIDYHGVVALESMKELRMYCVEFKEKEIVTICERSPLVEALEFRLCFSSNHDLQSRALNALGSLTKLAELRWYSDSAYVPAPSLVTEFVRDLARNSGASLRCLYLPYNMPLPTAAIEALAKGCGVLRVIRFNVRVGEATAASIRFLIDCIVAHPSWIHQTDQPTLVIDIFARNGGGDEEAGMSVLKALAAPTANLPAGVRLIM